MKIKISFLFILLLFLSNFNSFAHTNQTHFVVIPLGVKGGIVEDNLSAYLLAEQKSSNFVLLDAGTVMSGLLKNETQSSLNQLGFHSNSADALALDVLKNHIKAYLISHAHLDHIAGLVLVSPDDSKKVILGIDTTINYLRDYIFNWKIWPNFGSEGMPPFLNQYQYIRLARGEKTAIPNTSMQAEAMLLNHGNGYSSTAFLINSGKYYFLYFGDTGADEVEKSHNIELVWKRIAPLIQSGQLNTIFIESSYTNNRTDSLLFGHLNPKWLLAELNQLAKIVDKNHPETGLKDLQIVVTHIKPGIENGKPNVQIVAQQLESNNHLGVKFIIPQQGQLLSF